MLLGSRQVSGECQNGEFTCDNGKCLPQPWQCNGIDECGDGTDERHCAFGESVTLYRVCVAVVGLPPPPIDNI